MLHPLSKSTLKCTVSWLLRHSERLDRCKASRFYIHISCWMWLQNYFIFHSLSMAAYHTKGWEGAAGIYHSQYQARRSVYPRTSQQIINKQPNILLATSMGKLESPVKLTCMSLDCGKSAEHLDGTHGDTGRTGKLYSERPHPKNKTRVLVGEIVN